MSEEEGEGMPSDAILKEEPVPLDAFFKEDLGYHVRGSISSAF